MTLMQNQPRRGHLHGTNVNPESDSNGRSDGTDGGQDMRGYPHKTDSNPVTSSSGSIVRQPEDVRGYTGHLPAPPATRRINDHVDGGRDGSKV